MRRGSNLPAVGTYNQTVVLDLIRRAPGGMSRVELAERSGLSAQTLSNVTRRLVEEGLIAEAGKVISGPGKPRTLLALVPRSRFAIGIHLDPAVDTIVVIDMAGTVVAHAEHPPGRSTDAGRLIGSMADAVLDIITRAGIDEDRIVGVGVAAPGPLQDGRFLTPPLLPAWHGVSIRDGLAAATGLPIVVEKDVTAAVVGELWLDRGYDVGDAMFLYYGAGIGAGLAVGGMPVRGATGNAGDIAHLSVDPSGPICECGNAGCLGASLEPDTILRLAGIRSGQAPVEQLPADPRPELDRLRALAEEGDSAAMAAIALTARRLARGLVQLDNVLDMGVAVVGGPVWARLWPVLREPLRQSLAADPAIRTLRPLHLRDSRLGTDAAAVGAACLLLDGAFAARPSDLLITG
ncbi:ROK family transcriptional regulator [Microbacterium sp. cx-59]|uniref:ROK family transcriptional regulator n=1 Tax=Microbacterium sp. cx-59 TaxID=2891207 RepID=UPI001E52CC0C|nr:ROK family transcriptional regulator [Microbacterium sp. cx-59]MCC4909124.1 ROK family transcriptional regulator [Microbacterium sp. cx-59]